jgi:Ca2+-binding EF-hand superfamily protein
MEQSAFLRSLIGCSEDVFRSAFANMDKDGDKQISRSELVAFVEEANGTASEASLKQLFMLVDGARYSDDEDGPGGDGAMTLKELNRAIKEDEEVRQLILSTPALRSLLAPATRKTTFKAMDRDNNGKVRGLAFLVVAGILFSKRRANALT